MYIAYSLHIFMEILQIGLAAYWLFFACSAFIFHIFHIFLNILHILNCFAFFAYFVPTLGGIVENPSFWFPFCGVEKCAKNIPQSGPQKEPSSHEFDWIWCKLDIPSSQCFNFPL